MQVVLLRVGLHGLPPAAAEPGALTPGGVTREQCCCKWLLEMRFLEAGRERQALLDRVECCLQRKAIAAACLYGNPGFG